MKYLLSATCIIGQLAYIIQYEKKNIRPAVFFKTLASLSFLLLGYLNKQNSASAMDLYLLIGLFFDALGDILLVFRNIAYRDLMFIIGTLSFILGHIFYLQAFLVSGYPGSLTFALAGFLIGTAVFGFYLKVCTFSLSQKIVGAIYVVLIFTITGIAVCNFLNEQSLRNILIMISTLSFCISDNILIIYNFSKKEKWMHPLYTALYYLAQIIMANVIGL